jgi:cytochrome P450
MLGRTRSDALDVEDIGAVFREVLEDAPTLRHPNGVAFFKYDDVVEARRNPVITRAPMPGGPGMGMRGLLIPFDLEGDEHRKFRRLLDPLLAPRAIAYLEPEVRALADELIDGFAEAGEVDFYEAFALPMPCVIFLRLLGLPRADFPFLRRVEEDILHNGATTAEEHNEIAIAAGDRLRAYLIDELDRREREATPREDLIGRFLSFEVDGERLSRDQILNVIHMFVVAGLDTVTATLSCIVAWLARHPAERDQLVARPELIPGAIEELMRDQTPVPFERAGIAAVDTEIAGVAIAAGQSVGVCLGTANQDPHVFDDPARIDFERPNNRHLGFSSGVHRCLGSHLARLEMRVALETLHRRIPNYSMDPGKEAVYRREGVRTVRPLPLVFPPS